MPQPRRSFPLSRIIGLVALVALLVAMVVNTKFLNPEELAAAGPVKFDPKATATDLFTRAQSELPDKATEVGELVPALHSDVKAAAEKYGAISPAQGSNVFAVTTTATVAEATDASLRLEVDGVPASTPVLVPLTTAVNGTAIRDVVGFKFADAPGQTDYQYVGDELKKLMQAEIQTAVSDPSSLKGKKVTVVGAISVVGTTQPKPKPVNIQPVSIEVGS